MNNKDKYRQTFSAIHPTSESVERIIKMKDEKKANAVFKPLMAVAACMAILVVSVFGSGILSSAPVGNKTDTGAAINHALSMFAITANAQGDDTASEETPIELGVKVPLSYKLEIFDIRDKTQEDVELIIKQESDDIDPIDGGFVQATMSIESLNNVLIKQTEYNSFAISPNADKTVKSVEFKADSKYWEFGYFDSRYAPGSDKRIPLSSDIKLSCDEFYGILNANKECGKERLEMFLEHSNALCEAIDNNPSIDLKTFNDKLTFTVEYTDGTVEHGILNISFDTDGTLTLTRAK